MTRSWIIELTSLPTYPTSVYFVASTLKKGASVSLAKRRAIYVFPHPVGPWINKFFGVISSLRSDGRFFLLHLFLKDIAIAILAYFWPITYLSRYYTTRLGVITDSSIALCSNIFYASFDGPLSFSFWSTLSSEKLDEETNILKAVLFWKASNVTLRSILNILIKLLYACNKKLNSYYYHKQILNYLGKAKSY